MAFNIFAPFYYLPVLNLRNFIIFHSASKKKFFRNTANYEIKENI